MRNLWVDYAKGIGILLVVLGHVLGGLMRAGIAEGEIWGDIFNIIYTFHMPLFFLLSGMFVERSVVSKGVGSFVLSKIDTIAYPYFLWMIIQGVVLVFAASYTNGNSDVTWAGVFDLFPAKDQFWFLYDLFIMMMVSMLVLKFVPNPLMVMVILSAGMYVTMADIASTELAKLSAYLIYFVMGMVVSRIQTALAKNIGNYSGLLFLSAVGIFAQYAFTFSYEYKFNEYSGFSIFLAVVSILIVLSFSILLASKGASRWIANIGEASMIIFLGHIISSSGSRIVLQKFFGMDDITVHLLVGMLMGIAPWYLYYRFSRNYPILQFAYKSNVKGIISHNA